MKITYLAALLLGATLTVNAQGYKDGIEYYKAGQFENAITILNRNLNASDTDKGLANYYLGQAYLNQGDKAKARTYFDAGIAANPNCPYNYVGLGAIDLMNNAKTSAEANFKKAQGLAKKNAEISVDIARSYYNVNPVTYAKEIDKYIEKARKDSKNQEPAIYVFEGDRLTDGKDYNAAVAQYEQAMFFDPDNPEAYVKYANTYFQVVPNFAIAKLEELLRKQPNSALAQRELAEKYYDDGQLTKAAAQYGAYIANPNHFPQDKARYAVLLFADGKYEDAVRVSREASAENPNNVALQRIIYRSLGELSRTEEAIAEANKFFTLPAFKGKQNSGDYTIYAKLLTNSGQTPDAIEILQQGRVAIPDDASIARDLSTAYSKQGNATDAADAFATYLSLVKEPTTNDYNTASIRFFDATNENKDNEELRTKYSKAGVEYVNKIIDPANPRAAYSLRKLQLLLTGNGNIMNDEAAQAANDLIVALDADPVNADPANASNNLQVYSIVYNLLQKYYSDNGDTAAANNAKDKGDYYRNLMK